MFVESKRALESGNEKKASQAEIDPNSLCKGCLKYWNHISLFDFVKFGNASTVVLSRFAKSPEKIEQYLVKAK